MNDSWNPSKLECDVLAIIKERQAKERRGLHETEIARFVSRAHPDLYNRTEINDALVVLTGKRFLKKETETQKIPAIKSRYSNKIDVPARTHKLELYKVADKGILYLREINGDATYEVAIHSNTPDLRGSSAAVNAGTLEALHKQIQSKCTSLYLGSYYPEAVEKGFKVVRDRLREITTYETGSEAFGRGSLFINGASAKNVEHDFQEAVKFLTMAIDQFRNEKSHTSDGKIEDPVRAYEYLALSSLAMHLLDNSEVRPREDKPKSSKPTKVNDRADSGKTTVQLDPLQILALRLFANMSGQKELLLSRTSGGDSLHMMGNMVDAELLNELNSIEDVQEFEVNLDEMATWSLVTIEYGSYDSKRYKLAKEGYNVIKDHPEFKSSKK